MAIVAGIDEAGYGPLLGPLVVSGAAFEVPDEQADACLWNTLSASVTRSMARKDLRLPIADSKKLYSTKLGLGALERTALVMLGAAGRRPKTSRRLLDLLAPRSGACLAEYVWYDEFDAPLPTRCTEGEVATRTNAIKRDLADQGSRLMGVFCEPLMEGEFNRLVARVKNKAVVTLNLVLCVVQRIWARSADQRVIVYIDRQGGRTHYQQAIMTAFEGTELRIVEESDARSAYELTCGAVQRRLEFVTQGETHHLPVALASIYSKYLRELFMAAFNRYWASQVSGLKPTAGYYTDAQRFLGDVANVLATLKINRDLLVRSR
ncbi:MAG: hypothetical protein GY842_14360 [bacterium]|nr:hypothetical protein [bacterium]